MPGKPPRKRYAPGRKRLVGGRIVLTEAEYRRLLREGRPIPQGAEIRPGLEGLV